MITVTDNQPTLHEAIQEYFREYFEGDEQDRRFRSQTRKTRSRGRISERTVTVAPVPVAIRETGKWQGIQSVGLVHRHRDRWMRRGLGRSARAIT